MIYGNFLKRGIFTLAIFWPCLVSALEMTESTLDAHGAPLLQQYHSDDSASETDSYFDGDQESDPYNSDNDWLLTEDYTLINDQLEEENKTPWALADLKSEVYEQIANTTYGDIVHATKETLKTLEPSKYEKWELLNMMIHVNPKRFEAVSTILSNLPKPTVSEAYVALMTAIITAPAAHCAERCEFLQTVLDYAKIKKIEITHAMNVFDLLRFLQRCEMYKVENGFSFVKREHSNVKELSDIMLLIQSYAKISMDKYSLVSKILSPFREDFKVYEAICRDLSQFPSKHFDAILNKFKDEGIGSELVPDFAQIIHALLEINNDDRLFVFEVVCKTHSSANWLKALKKHKMPYEQY